MGIKLSVAMATYNGELYIAEQIESILAQLPADSEIVISDDGSTDATLEIIRGYQNADGRIRLLDGPKAGVIANFENAIGHCQGDYIFLSDQDDVWMEDKVKKVMAEFGFRLGETGAYEQMDLDCSSPVLVIHDAIVTNVDLSQVLYPSFFEFRNCKAGFWTNIWKNRFIGCCMAFHKSVKEIALPIPRDIPMHDQWIGLLAEKNFGRSTFLREPLLKYRRHDDNVSDFNHNSIWVMLRNRIRLLKYINQRKHKK